MALKTSSPISILSMSRCVPMITVRSSSSSGSLDSDDVDFNLDDPSSVVASSVAVNDVVVDILCSAASASSVSSGIVPESSGTMTPSYRFEPVTA